MDSRKNGGDSIGGTEMRMLENYEEGEAPMPVVENTKSTVPFDEAFGGFNGLWRGLSCRGTPTQD